MHVILRIVSGTLLSFLLVSSSLAELSVNISCSLLQVNTYPSTCNAPPLSSSSGNYTAGALYSTPIFSGSAGNNSYQADASARADYGSLGVFAFATAQNGTSGDSDTRTMQLLAKSISQWSDTYTIGGASGTYVDIKVDQLIHIGGLSRNADGGMLSTGLITFNSSLSDNWCWEEGAPGACSSALQLSAGDNQISSVAHLLAGSTMTWSSVLYGEAQVYNPAVGSGSVNVDAINTAHTYFTVLTPGASIQWASGSTYSVPSAVPEPATYAMLGLGLGLMGWVARRKPARSARM